MLFELSVASKYLIPRWRQLSVSIIASISILVIALVVWLVLVFLSVANGIEKNWIEKLVALNGPVQATPTANYYQSYYYLIDSLSSASDYNYKTLQEKKEAPASDPYNATIDSEIPRYWSAPDKDSQGNLKDPVKLLFQALNTIEGVPGLRSHSFELALTQMRLRLIRHHFNNTSHYSNPTQSFISPQSTFFAVSSFDGDNVRLQHTLLPPSTQDLSNLLFLLSISGKNNQEDKPEDIAYISATNFRLKLASFFDNLKINALQAPEDGWIVPKNLFPESGTFKACLLSRPNQGPFQLIASLDTNEKKGFKSEVVSVKYQKPHFFIVRGKQEEVLADDIPLVLPEGTLIPCSFVANSLKTARQVSELEFSINLSLQGLAIKGVIPYGPLEIGLAEPKTLFSTPPEHPPFWTYRIGSTSVLPQSLEIGEGALLSYRFHESGILMGDRGYLTYSTATASGVQEQRIPIYVAGFYDSGVMPIGSKLVLVNSDITSLIRSSVEQQGSQSETGFSIWFDNLNKADTVKTQLQDLLQKYGVDTYWKIESYKDYEFSKNLFQQFQSDRHLLSLIACIIILIASSNIISMLIILVNDKKREIGILRSMGASSLSIAAIFGTCGLVMGLVGSALGVGLAYITLDNLQLLVDLMSSIQGHDAFQAIYYGSSLPNEMSADALLFVSIATVVMSLLAGVIPAVKASLLKPSQILRSE